MIYNVISITPNLVIVGKKITYTLTVNSNLLVELIDFKLKYDDNSVDLTCAPDKTNKTKVICTGSISYEGEYNLFIYDELKFFYINVTAKNISSFFTFSPSSISPSSKSQNIYLFSKDDISSWVNNIKFVGNEVLQPTCNLTSKIVLNCSAVFNKEDKYYISFDEFNMGSYINVNEEDNINPEKKI